jgi:hypothetical protein
MAEAKTKPTKVDVKTFIAAVENDARRADALALLKIFESATGWKATMWGPSIVGFGRYTYVYDSGHSGDMCVTGFSPRKANLVIYPGLYPEEAGDILKKLGKHKASKACIYVNRLSDIDLAVLERLIKAGVASVKNKWPVSAS